MKIITSINAKGGCGKSTLAMNIAAGLGLKGFKTLLIDMDPQAQVTQWLGLGDGLQNDRTIVPVLAGRAQLADVVQATEFENLSFVAAAIGLEDFGRKITEAQGYETIFAQALTAGGAPNYDFLVIDSPNQISPVMENAIYPTDVFVVPFEGPQAVRSYANFFKLVLEIRPDQAYRVLHVLNDVSKQEGLRKAVVEILDAAGLAIARTEIRTCGWLAKVSEHRGSIFHYRPHSNGAEDVGKLVDELLDVTGMSTVEKVQHAELPVEPETAV
ncbi:MAG TPA: ParA family protein, partial [Tepidisphaeraceae bacterium]|nr:ParA family protein [Tepidisphaeraceae bacterium]